MGNKAFSVALMAVVMTSVLGMGKGFARIPDGEARRRRDRVVSKSGERLSRRLEEASQGIAERHDQFEKSDVTEVDSKSNED